MSIADRIREFFARPADETNGTAPDGACPNCWGYYEFDNQVRRAAREQRIDLVNGRENHAFIRQFVEEHIDGIRVESTPEGLYCPRCERVRPAS